MVYQGTVQNGVVVVDGGVKLPDGVVVRIEPVDPVSDPQQPLPQNDPLFRMSELAVDTGIPDLAANVDHYLYGHPKVNNGQ